VARCTYTPAYSERVAANLERYAPLLMAAAGDLVEAVAGKVTE